eukprot:scaffold722_cov64-Phaeocystis_antarctica.AAC.1
MLPIEPRHLLGRDEELRAVGVRARVGHRERARSAVLDREVLVGEPRVAALPAGQCGVDALAATPVAAGEVAALDHEAGDHAVEGAARVRQLMAALAHALLAATRWTRTRVSWREHRRWLAGLRRTLCRAL